MIKTRETERFNHIAVNDQKRPFIKDWQHKFWSQKNVWKGQYGVGFKQSINHTTIDVDTPELNDKIDKLFMDKLLLVKSGSGKRHIIISQTPESFGVGNSHLYLNGAKVADLLTCYNKQALMPNFWGLNLPASDKYILINGKEEDFYNPPQVNMFDIIDALGLSFKQPEPSQTPSKTVHKPILATFSPRESFSSFNLENYVPTSHGMTHAGMAPLLRAIYNYGLEDKKDEIFVEYINLARIRGFGHRTDEDYLKQWNSWNKGFNKNKTSILSHIPLKHIKFKEIVLKNLNQYKPTTYKEQLIITGSKRGGNRDSEFLNRLLLICKDLAQFSATKEFYLGCNWEIEGIHPMKVARGLKTLELHGYIKLIAKGEKGRDSKKANRYQLTQKERLTNVNI